jgi:chromate transporter
LLPAPLIIFSTFVGYVGGGPLGALVMTFTTFLPAFAMTLIAHEPMERIIHDPRVRTFLDGLTAAVVGLIAGTALTLLISNVHGVIAGFVFAAALAALFWSNSKLAVPLVIAGAALVGVVAMKLGA